MIFVSYAHADDMGREGFGWVTLNMSAPKTAADVSALAARLQGQDIAAGLSNSARIIPLWWKEIEDG